ncbi:MAG: MarC family protein [Verrucomicrobia bacterium]|nr:MarC family protein [Verrucomicrobiota bacterium]
MAEFFSSALSAFVPLFLAVDPLGTVPLYLAMAEEFPLRERRAIARHSLLTAVPLSIAFVVGGEAIFGVLGIQDEDFFIAGGAILFLLALLDIGGFERQHRVMGRFVGVVPLGTPLIAGPATLAAALVMVKRHGMWPTLSALAANMALLWLALRFAEPISRLVGSAGLRAISKLIMLLLAALAVMLIRQGIAQIVHGG